MNVRVITASAGTGKTYRLTQELEHAITSGRARPEGIIATTFTTEAAAELVERARGRLLQAGRASDAQRLLAARIGTVNSVCGALVTEFAFELGLSPRTIVLDEEAAALELRRALTRVVTSEQAEELDEFRARFEPERDWRLDVKRIVDAARANGMGVAQLVASGDRSCRELDAGLGPTTGEDLDAALAAAIVRAMGEIGSSDDTKVTASYLDTLGACVAELRHARAPSWGTWATIASKKVGARSADRFAAVKAIANRHVEHPRLRRELHRIIELLFEVSAATLAAYQEHKRARSVVDFADQEVLALELLGRADIREALAGELDLVLVDEFQDTSPIQLALFLELAKLANESIWVGDPKQAIFAFRGTDPALMDAAIESMASGFHDADLVERAAAKVGQHVATLSVSFRSRPELVALTSDVFAPVFASQGIPEARTRLVAHLASDPAPLGPIVEYWPLGLDRGAGTDNAAGRASAAAAGVRELLGRGVPVRGRRDPAEGVRPAKPSDLAILCRTNKQCQEVADALAAQAIPAVVPRMGLLATTEGQLVQAGLALWLDPSDALAAAEVARIVSYPTDLDGMLGRVLEVPGRDAFAEDPPVARLLAARKDAHDLGPVAAIDAVIQSAELRQLCAAWGNTVQRLANLDALRAHAAVYSTETIKSGGTATLSGLLRHFEGLAPRAKRWDQVAGDRQALPVADDAVTVSTWHRSKGLEWPVTILFGLETLREPIAYGVHVMSERAEFDVSDPLGGRWLRYWPNPYTTLNQGGAVRDALERTSAHRSVMAKADGEALRVLYVGWTRARDRLVFAAERGELLKGIVGKLGPGLISEPRASDAGEEVVQWAGRRVAIGAVPTSPVPRMAVPAAPGEVAVGRSGAVYPPARATPSKAAAVPCTIGETVHLGERVALVGAPEMEVIGDAIHAFLAADRASTPDAGRQARASAILARFGLDANLATHDLVAIGTRLWSWIAARFEGGRLHREWPIAHRTAAGTVVAGTADLVVDAPSGLVVIDHKAFPGTAGTARERAVRHSGQLEAYRAALAVATQREVASTWLHFPILGTVVQVQVDRSKASALRSSPAT